MLLKVGSTEVPLNILDTSGQEEFPAMQGQYRKVPKLSDTD